MIDHKPNNPVVIAIPSHIDPPITGHDDDVTDEFTEIEINNNSKLTNNDNSNLQRQPHKRQGDGGAERENSSSPAVAAFAAAGDNWGSSGGMEAEDEPDLPPDTSVDSGQKGGVSIGVFFPNEENLPKPQPPRGVLLPIPTKRHDDAVVSIRPKSPTSAPPSPNNLSAVRRFLRHRSNVISSAIAKQLTLPSSDETREDTEVTEFNLSGVKVIVQEKGKQALLRGRVTFFSRSNCRDCGAVRSFLRGRGLNYAEINVDVFPSRKRELVERTGTSTVPQIFFNDKLVGGLTELNALRMGNGLEDTLRKTLGCRCPDDVPEPSVYGFDDDDVDERTDKMSGIVRVLRQRLPIHDRLIRMRIVKNCFTGTELVDFLAWHFDCDRTQAVEIGKELMKKHFIHHVFGEHGFQDSSHMYRFLEHEHYIPKCYNFRGSTNDMEPKVASAIGQRITEIMFAILESYASEDRKHIDYVAISNSEEFRRYLNLLHSLQRVDILKLSPNEKLAFFLNLYNAMVIHAVIRIGHPQGMMDRKSFVNDFQYLVGGQPYSLSAIRNGILRSNKRPPHSFTKPFPAGDKRLEVALPAVNPLIHFGLCDGARSSPTVRFFIPQNVEAELRAATREFFSEGGIEIDLIKRTVYLSSIIKWFSMDFGGDREILKWLLNYLVANKAGLVTHLLGDGGVVNISYRNYDWSLNSECLSSFSANRPGS